MKQLFARILKRVGSRISMNPLPSSTPTKPTTYQTCCYRTEYSLNSKVFLTMRTDENSKVSYDLILASSCEFCFTETIGSEKTARHYIRIGQNGLEYRGQLETAYRRIG
jgi:hypothetical protein